MLTTKIINIDSRGAAFAACMSDFFAKNMLYGDAIEVTFENGATLHDIPFYSGKYQKVFETAVVVNEKNGKIMKRDGDIVKELKLEAGNTVSFELSKKGEFAEYEHAYSFDRLNDVSMYETKEEFANFRPLYPSFDGFYRASSPFDNAYGRATAVAECVRRYGVQTIVDFSDAKEEIDYLLEHGSALIRDIMQDVEIVALGDDAKLFSKEFDNATMEAIRYACVKKMPILYCCRTGKERSGFVSMILQALSGWSYQKIADEYMLSYTNNNGISMEDNQQRYIRTERDTIGEMLRYIGAEENSQRTYEPARNYLLDNGLSGDDFIKLAGRLPF